MTTTLAIQNMSCGHCVSHVTKALAAVPGVTVRDVTIGRAVVERAPEAPPRALLAALDDAGYPATVESEA